MISLTTLQLPNYQTTEQIYNGNRTIVYRGICSDSGKPVVIKLLKKDYPTFNEIVQFRNQYTITKNLDLAGIVKPTALETYGNGLALIMEDDGSISLSEELKSRRSKSFFLEEFFPIAIQLTEILEGLSKNRVIHKDIKPANILIHPETRQVKLIDFSIASLLPKEQQEIQNPNILEGTLAYISPEQTGRMNRGIDYRSDFYSLGVSFYQMLSGKLPFDSDDAMELVHCHLTKIPKSLSTRGDIPKVVSDIVMKLIAKNGEERYQSALGLKYDLQKCFFQWLKTGQVEAFELGERDICDRFLIPEKLYGREKEVQTLLGSFNRVAEGQREMMLVAGFSGIGKTAVVNEVHKPITRQNGYFIKGKFDQFNRNIPLAAFVQALRDLLGQLLSESDAKLTKWQTKILEALGENAQVLIEVIPELEQVLGPQPQAPELEGAAAQNRFNLLFQNFIEVFTTPNHPLVIFLDDLQWADSASLQLIKLLMKDKSHLLLLGAYRDNEVSPAHPFMLTISELKQGEAPVNTITLAPLTFFDTNQLVADTLYCSPERSQPLTELLVRKTKGNPFFTTQFLKALHEDGHITFNYDQGYWEGNLAQIQVLSLTDDVVEFMAQQLQKLPDATQEALKLAACIGNQFDLETLAIVSEQSPTAIANSLWEALDEYFIVPTSQIYKFFQGENLDQSNSDRAVNQDSVNLTYNFLHDRVQQAAYSLIPESKKQITHLQIGQLLLNNTLEEERDKRIFDIVNQLNAGIELIDNLSKREQLAQLNLKAGQKAKLATAYGTAVNYLNTGLQLLPPQSWQQKYNLTLKFHELLAESEYLNTNFATSKNLVEQTLINGRTPLDKVKVYEIQIQSYTAQNKLMEAISIGREALGLLEVDFPEGCDFETISIEHENLKSLLGQGQIATLADLPALQAPHQSAALRILAGLFASVYLAQPELLPLKIFTMVKICIQAGNSPQGAIAYVLYGLFLCATGEIEQGYQFGTLARTILEKFQAKELTSKINLLFGLFVNHWKKTVRSTLPVFLDGLTSGLDNGDLEYVGYCANCYCQFLFWTGDNLEFAESEANKYCELMEEIKQEISLIWANTWRQTVINLRGKAENPTMLVGSSFNEAETLPVLIQSQNVNGICYVYLAKLLLSYLFEEYQTAKNYGSKFEEYEQGAAGLLIVPLKNFYQSLSLLALHPDGDETEKALILEQIAANQKSLEIWANHAPMNHLHKFQLVEAETYRILGDNYKAGDWYDRAIAGAKANGYTNEESLANELAAKFYLSWGKAKVAAGYMQEAYYCYAHWGAKAKIEQLQTVYPQLLVPILQNKEEEELEIKEDTFTSSYSVSSTQTALRESLDFNMVLKASQSLSQEIHLESLLCLLMEVIVTNAGASEGALLWVKDNHLSVAANWQEGNLCGIPNLSLEEYHNLPLSIVNKVKRTQETIIINQGLTRNRWANDAYLMKYRPHSFLCMPIIRQGKLLALLYLENRLTLGAFTKQRLKILTMLTAQAAISLENAQLYHTLEEKVEQRTRELRAAQQQIISQEKLASLGALTAGVAHELRNPLNFVTNYAEGSMEMGTELIEEFQGQQPPKEEDWEYVQETITDLKDNAAAIHKHSQRAESIIYNMMQHSRSDDKSRQMTNINQLLDEARQLSYHSRRSRDNSFNITFTTEYDESVGELEVFSASLSRAFINLIDNGCYAAWSKYLDQGEAFSPELRVGTKNLGTKVEIHIRDNGTGIPDEVKEKLFEPFFTTKPTGEGTGLGLSLTHEIIVGQHGGTLKVNTEPGNFTEFIIALPQNT